MEKEQVWPFLLTAADISCTTTALLFFFPQLDHKSPSAGSTHGRLLAVAVKSEPAEEPNPEAETAAQETETVVVEEEATEDGDKEVKKEEEKVGNGRIKSHDS